MGMYNEISHECPHCKLEGKRELGHGQISQVVDGFGPGHVISDLRSLQRQLEDKAMTPDELRRVIRCAEGTWLTCGACDRTFQPDPAYLLAAKMLAERFELVTNVDTKSRARNLYRELYPDG